MSAGDDFTAELQELAEHLAEARIRALSGAVTIFLTDIYDVLLQRGVLTEGELSTRLTKIEALASETRPVAPLLARFATDSAFAIRSGLDLVAKTSN